MRRLRVLRFLLLALLVPFVVVLVLMIRQPAGVHTDPRRLLGRLQGGPRAEGIQGELLLGKERKIYIDAGVAEQDADGSLRLEDIRRLEVSREGDSPLIIGASEGRVSGDAGNLLMRFDGGVTIKDEEDDASLFLPALEVNESSGEARSLGAVEFDAPTYNGRAASVVYGLDDQPTVIHAPEIRTSDDSLLRAERARLIDGTRHVEFEGGVDAVDGDYRFHSVRVILKRRENGQLAHLLATDDLRVTSSASDALFSQIQAERAELEWDETGRATAVLLEGNSLVQRAGRTLTANRVEARRESGGDTWSFAAIDNVHVETVVDSGSAILTASELRGSVGEDGALLGGEAVGNVRYEGVRTFAEGARAIFEPARPGREIVLHASPQRRARLALEKSRVSAKRIVTEPRGTYLLAEGQVEASLLPGREGRRAPSSGLFEVDEAVHFVAARLEGNPDRSQLVFTGAVRGWQGDRNLAADRVEVDQETDRLLARGRVTTRIPRAETSAVSEADFVQIAADQLDYRGEQGTAVYTGGVRVRQAEGWLEGGELEIDLAGEGRSIREMRGSGEIRFEFRAPDSRGMPRPVAGTGDRVRYLPGEGVITLFGDQAPASVRREGEGGGTTTGRVLRYYLATGSLEVQSGDRDRARIRTSAEPEPEAEPEGDEP